MSAYTFEVHTNREKGLFQLLSVLHVAQRICHECDSKLHFEAGTCRILFDAVIVNEGLI